MLNIFVKTTVHFFQDWLQKYNIINVITVTFDQITDLKHFTSVGGNKSIFLLLV